MMPLLRPLHDAAAAAGGGSVDTAVRGGADLEAAADHDI